MQSDELQQILKYPFGVEKPVSTRVSALRQRGIGEFAAAGSYSLPFAVQPSYGEVLLLVARRLKIPVPLNAAAPDVERSILFRTLQRSIDSMDAKAKNEFLQKVQGDLEERGIKGQWMRITEANLISNALQNAYGFSFQCFRT